MTKPVRWGAMSAVVVLLAGCGTSGSNAGSASRIPALSVSSTSLPLTTARPQLVTLSPARGLRDQQVVHVVGHGYTPGQTGIAVVECADKGTSTGQDDCNIGGIKLATVDSTGSVTADFPVAVGPFGGAGVVCSARQRCLISVTQLTLTPTEFASSPITFA